MMAFDLRPKALTHDALNQIRVVLTESESQTEFLARADAIIREPNNVLELPFEALVAEPLIVGNDSQNTALVYDQIGALDPANAADPRLWTYLAFVTHREYMEQRWSLDEGRSWKSRVTDRWLIMNGTRGRLIRHGIARLWWIASLTYDAKKEFKLSSLTNDSFAYARQVFMNEDRVIQIFDREIATNERLIRAVLERCARGGDFAQDKFVRQVMKELVLVGGYRDTDFLTDEQLSELVDSSYQPAEMANSV